LETDEKWPTGPQPRVVSEWVSFATLGEANEIITEVPERPASARPEDFKERL
jgi:hypothetical protein